MTEPGGVSSGQVEHFRQILLWPLQLMPAGEDGRYPNPEELLTQGDVRAPWREVADEFTEDPALFQERHYKEFLAFLPYVQRLLYGEGRGRGVASGESPIRAFRRGDVAQVRLTSTGEDSGPLTFEVKHVDLYFFLAMDVAILAVEIAGGPLSLRRVQDTLYRFGRAYPTQWDDDGHGRHCPAKTEWLSASGEVLSTSDYERREKYLSQVCRHRAPRLSSHWEWLLRPLVPHHSDENGSGRYRLVEYHRMPLMAYLAADDPNRLTRGDFVRLALVTAPGPSEILPFSEPYLRQFEDRHCLDRYWNPRGEHAPGARYLCSGDAFILVGSAKDPYFRDPERGLLGQFRHQHFLLFLLPHMQKAALFMMSDRLVDAINRLDPGSADSVKRFKRKIRRLEQVFLGFTHGYWFHDVSDQAQARDLYRVCREWLDVSRVYAEVRDEIEDMIAYLDTDTFRRQANTVVRLTVVTIFGLIGTITTGFLGMNLWSEGDNPLWLKFVYFLLILLPVIGLTAYTMVKSKRLSDFLDDLSDERLPLRAKMSALLDVWRRPRKVTRSTVLARLQD